MVRRPDAAPRPLALAFAWPRSVAAYVFLSLFVLGVGPPALLAVACGARPSLLIALGLFAVRICRRMLGLRYQVSGIEHVNGNRPTVYCINHESNVDVLVFDVLYRKCPRLKGLYKAEMDRLPVLGRVLAAVDFIAVDRGNRNQTGRAVERAIDRLREGDSFVLAPEGTRSLSGELLPFKRGAFVMAIGAQVPVVPIGIAGGRDAMARGSVVVRSAVLRMQIGAPVETAGMTGDDCGRLTDIVRSRIEALRRTPDVPDRKV